MIREYEEDERITALCLSCTKPDCTGTCAEIVRLQREINGDDYSVTLYEHNGMRMSMQEWADHIGCSYYCLWRRVNVLGMTINEAIDYGKPLPTPLHTAFGRQQTMRGWSKEFGISLPTLRSRMRAGMTLEQALSKPVRPKKEAR